MLVVLVLDALRTHLDSGLGLTAFVLTVATALPFDSQADLGTEIAIIAASGTWAGACLPFSLVGQVTWVSTHHPADANEIDVL